MTDPEITEWLAGESPTARRDVARAFVDGCRWTGAMTPQAATMCGRVSVEIEIVRRRWLARERMVCPRFVGESTMDMRDPFDVLARTMWGEARGEGRRGMEAVAAVVMNRVGHPTWWGHDVISVCIAPDQFSCWNQGDPNRAKLAAVTGADSMFVCALAVAQTSIAGHLTDPTNGADSYYARGTPEPAWAKGRTLAAAIGNHLFFRTVAPPYAPVPCDVDAMDDDALPEGTQS